VVRSEDAARADQRYKADQQEDSRAQQQENCGSPFHAIPVGIMRQRFNWHNDLALGRRCSVRYGMGIPDLTREIRNHFCAWSLSAEN
jgi:hypothetical protein